MRIPISLNYNNAIFREKCWQLKFRNLYHDRSHKKHIHSDERDAVKLPFSLKWTIWPLTGFHSITVDQAQDLNKMFPLNIEAP